MSARLEILLLGPLCVRYEGHPVQDQLSPKVGALLCYLAVNGGVISRQKVAALLWGDASEQKALGSLRVALNALRKVMPDAVVGTYATIALNPELELWLDVTACAEQLRAAQTAAPADLLAALALYRGDFLADLLVDNAPAFEEWVLLQRAYWQQRVLASLAQVGEQLLTSQDYHRAIAVLQRRLAIEPWEEEAHRQLMVAYSRLGDLNAALAQYETCRRLLVRELGVDPMPETEALAERIYTARLARPPEIPASATPFVGRESELDRLRLLLTHPGCRLITILGLGGIGKTRLAQEAARRLAHEEAITFLNGVVFVSLTGVDAPAAVPFAIAQALALPLAGRMTPQAELVRFLRNQELLLVLDGIEPLLPTTGAAGAGENVLALLEQLIEACPLLKVLVTSREALNLSSEWRLQLEGLLLPPLDEPAVPLDVIAQNYSAVQLFLNTALQVRPDFRLSAANLPHVRQLCHLVGGMPLALQLAASWLRAMDVAAIVAELQRNLDLLTARQRTIAPRQRSIRAIFEQTWALLPEAEQQVLAPLALFRGSFTGGAAAQVAHATPFDLVNLADRGLLQVREQAGESRYELHELVRQFAAQRLVGGALAAASRRHGAFYLAVAESAERVLSTSADPAILNDLTLDRDNFLAALAWSVQQGASAADRETGLRLIAALWSAWLWWAAWAEGRQWLGRLVGESQGMEASLGRVRALRCAGYASHLDRNLTASALLYEEAVALCHQLVDTTEQASSRLALAVSLRDLGQLEAARRRLVESRLLWEATGNRWGSCLVMAEIGHVAIRQGDYEEARRAFEASLERARSLAEGWYSIYALHNLLVLALVEQKKATAWQHYEEIITRYHRLPNKAPQMHALASVTFSAFALGNVVPWSAYFVGDYATAQTLFEQHLAESHARGDELLTAWLLNHLGDVMRSSGDSSRASTLYQQSLTIFERLENWGGAALPLHNLGYIHLHAGALDLARDHFAVALRRTHDAGLAWNAADCLIGFAALAYAAGEHERTARLIGAAHAIQAAVDVSGAYGSPAIRHEAETVTAAVRNILGEVAWQTYCAAGASLTQAEAVRFALAR